MKSIVLGCGRMGDRHVQALKNLDVNISGIFDINLEASLQLCEKHHLNNAVVCKNIDQALDIANIDICVIATTAPYHKKLILQAIDAGIKNIVCEKPLAVSINECNEVIAYANKYNIKVAVNHQMRYMEQYIVPKQLLSSPEFGGLQSITVNAGNFGMAMNGIHYIEMLRFMSDDTPQSITAWFDQDDLPNPRGAQYKDKSGSLRITTTSGKVLYLNASTHHGHGVVVNYIAKHGQIIVDELTGMMYETCRNATERDFPTTRYGQPHVTKISQIPSVDIVTSTEKVISALINDKDYPNLYDASLAIQTLIAGYVSAENNHQNIAINDPRIDNKRVFPWA